MKKLILLILVVLLSLSIVACNGTTPDTNNGDNTTKNEFDTSKITFASAYAKAQNLGFEGTLEEFIELISGKDGADGKDGVGIVNVTVDENGNLLVTLSSGATINCGKVSGKDGVDGTNGQDGKDGVNGKDGTDGKTPYIENGYWYIDGVNTGVKAEGSDGKDGTNGKDGADGKDGVDGYDGKDGADGKDGVTPTIEISTDGYWVINGVKTEYKAVADGSGEDTHPHSFGEWIRYTYDANTPCDAWLYYRICAACKDIEWKNGGYENHSFTTVTVEPTCIAQGYDENTCSVCGLVEKINYTDIAGHIYNETYSHSDSFHWLDCKYCDSTTNYGEHNIDDSGYCTVCDQPLAPTEGIIYELSADGTYAEVLGYSGSATKIVIADTYNGVPVTTIYDESFKENKSITSVVIPDSVTSIGSDAFYGCSKLVSVIIGNSVTSIGDYAFAWCSNLTSAIIGNSVTLIGSASFACCSNLASVTIGSSVTSIGYQAFYYCSKLTSITIPDSVTSIGSDAFAWCSNLTSAIIGNSVTCIGDQAFWHCSTLSSVTIGSSVTSIGSSAFSDCNSTLYTEYEYGKYLRSGNNSYAVLLGLTNKNLSTYTINENTKIISYGVFLDCSRLTSITIPNSVTSIGHRAFDGCSNLTSITIPDSVTLIGGASFASCSNLTSITIPDSVSTIDVQAFYGCSKLTSITIPDSVISIGNFAFEDCSNLTNVYYSGSEEDWKKIAIASGNDELTDANIHYNYVPEE